MLFPFLSIAQEPDSVATKIVYDGDTMAFDLLPAVPVGEGGQEFWANYHHAMKWVPKIYYYSALIKELSVMHDSVLGSLETRKEQIKYVRKNKKDVKKEFGAAIKEMSTTRSFYMIKLIDRETDKMAYEILAGYIGKPKASMWQMISRLGGANLKEHYDAQGDDGYIELVVRQIEDGSLEFEDHSPKTEDGKKALSKRKAKIEKRRLKEEAKKKLENDGKEASN
ncbi:MAG: hypothetical protein ACI9J3_003011 [Parvicellaceae bacterium]|jgi:hypothetical protein